MSRPSGEHATSYTAPCKIPFISANQKCSASENSMWPYLVSKEFICSELGFKVPNHQHAILSTRHQLLHRGHPCEGIDGASVPSKSALQHRVRGFHGVLLKYVPKGTTVRCSWKRSGNRKDIQEYCRLAPLGLLLQCVEKVQYPIGVYYK